MVSNFFTSLLTSALPFYGRLLSDNIKIMINTLRPVSFAKDVVVEDPTVQLNGLAILRTGIVDVVAKRDGENPIIVATLRDNSVIYPIETIKASERDYKLELFIREDAEFFLIPNSLYKNLLDKEALVEEFNNTTIAEIYETWIYVIEQIADYNAVSKIANWIMQSYSKKKILIVPELFVQCAKDTIISEYLVNLIITDLMEQGVLHKRHNTEILEISSRSELMNLIKSQ